MSSGPDRDEFIDYLEDKSQNEDETLFIPAQEGRPDSWTVFYVGILTGVAGGGLFPLSLWLGASLIFFGYGMTVLSFGKPRSKFARAMRYGFAFASLLGGLLLAIAAFFPESSWRFMEMAMKHQLVFFSVSILPWAATLFRYCYTLFTPGRVKMRRPA